MQIPTRNLVLVALFAALTAVGAWIVIPVAPVPFTFQIIFVLLSGVLLGPWYGALSQLIYVLLGVVGLPVFAGGASGLGVIFGPTGGYLLGFILSAFVIGKVYGVLNQSYLAAFVSMFLGIIVIHLLGMVQLAVVARLSLWNAFLGGVLPFVGFDMLKMIFAAFIAQRLQMAGIGIAASNES